MPPKTASSLTDEQLIDYLENYYQLISNEASEALIDMTKLIIQQIKDEMEKRGLKHALL